MITSSSNPQIRYIKQLLETKKTRDKDGCFVAEGEKLFREILRDCPGQITKVYFSESFCEGKEVESLCNADYEVVSDRVFEQASETVTPQGVLCIVKKPEYGPKEFIKGEKARILVLESLRDPGNMGTVFRTAEGAGIDLVILTGDCADVFNPKVVRSTMGSVLRVPFAEIRDPKEVINMLREAGITTYATYLKASEELGKTVFPKKAAFFIGNESRGLAEETAMECDHRIRIPMAGKVESLNAAVAAAIVMYKSVLD